jgi:hypothetical protein
MRKYVELFCENFRSGDRQSAKLFLQSFELGLPHPLTGRVCPSL